MPGQPEAFVDIHCHLLPGVDDGAASWEDTLAMARMFMAEGFTTVVATPHQRGSFAQNGGDRVRSLVRETQAFLHQQGAPLTVLPGADVRIDEDLLAGLASGDVLTLGDHRRHVLLELPHELYLPLDDLLQELDARDMVGILSHPERNRGILHDPAVVDGLVDAGCLMQVTAGSLTGDFRASVEQFSRRLVRSGLVHIVSTDAHNVKSRPPRMRPAFEILVAEIGWEAAAELCCRNPARIAAGLEVEPGRQRIKKVSFGARVQRTLSGMLSSVAGRDSRRESGR